MGVFQCPYKQGIFAFSRLSIHESLVLRILKIRERQKRQPPTGNGNRNNKQIYKNKRIMYNNKYLLSCLYRRRMKYG